ncbi:MAG: hypothetical protein JWP53_2627 [Conexibacter sp.]|jgi:hypothetical protein|nr:hypothetical protein [Conexibacter sp.]MDX6731102.1 hypothetical protein [Baekduia sp.]
MSHARERVQGGLMDLLSLVLIVAIFGSLLGLVELLDRV